MANPLEAWRHDNTAEMLKEKAVVDNQSVATQATLNAALRLFLDTDQPESRATATITTTTDASKVQANGLAKGGGAQQWEWQGSSDDSQIVGWLRQNNRTAGRLTIDRGKGSWAVSETDNRGTPLLSFDTTCQTAAPTAICTGELRRAGDTVASIKTVESYANDRTHWLTYELRSPDQKSLLGTITIDDRSDAAENLILDIELHKTQNQAP